MKPNTKADFEDVIKDVIYKYDFKTLASYDVKITIDTKKELILNLTTNEDGYNLDNTLAFKPYTKDSNLIKVTYDHNWSHIDDDSGDQRSSYAILVLLTPETMMQCLNAPFMDKFYKLFDSKDAHYIKSNLTVLCQRLQHANKHKNCGLTE